MDSRALAALLSSLVSQLLLILLLFPSSNPLSLTDSDSDANNSKSVNLNPLIRHFLSTSEIVASISLLSVSRKRKRTHQPQPHSTDRDDEGLEPLGQVDSAIPQSPDSFKFCFRMSSPTFEWLSGLLEPLLDCRDPVDSPLNLSAEARLGIGLFRLSTGADYPEISRRFQVRQAVARFCVKQLCRVLCTNFRFWVGFPSPTELDSVSAAFETLAGLPNCCGIIDCTRFKIVRNSGCESSSKDKSRDESIAAQIVVDSSSRILSIVAGFHGDNANSRVLKSSTLYKDIEGGGLMNLPPICIKDVSVPQYFVGNGGYPLLPWLLVPFVDPVSGSIEEGFNAAHHLMSRPVLKTIASLKNWGILSKPIEEEFKTAVAYIGACSILHNVLLMREDEDYSAFLDGLGDYSMHDRRSPYYRGCSWEGNLIEEKASVVRNALAAKAREFLKPR